MACRTLSNPHGNYEITDSTEHLIGATNHGGAYAKEEYNVDLMILKAKNLF